MCKIIIVTILTKSIYVVTAYKIRNKYGLLINVQLLYRGSVMYIYLMMDSPVC